MQDDLVRAGIKSAPYLEESPMPRPPLGDQFRQRVPPSCDFERLNSFRVPCEGQWLIQTRISWKAREPSPPGRDMLILLEVDQLPYYKGSLMEGITKSYSEALRLKANDVVHLYVNHNSPYPAEVEYSVSFTRVDKGA